MRNVTEADLVKVDLELVKRQGLYRFVKLAWPYVETAPYVDSWHIETLCSVLERVTLGEIKKLVINVPPGCTKSKLVNVLWPVWHWTRDPTFRWLFASGDIQLTRRDANTAIDLISSAWFQSRWSNVRLASAIPSVEYHLTTAKGWRLSTSIGGKAIGWHPHAQVIDDPHKPAQALNRSAHISEQALSRVESWWQNTMPTRAADPANLRRVIIMQRLAERDLSGVTLATGEYEHVRLPMRFELDNANPYDRRTRDGELLNPIRFSDADVKQLEKDLGEEAPAQLQQRPVAKGGNLLERAWIQRYETRPKHFSQLVQSWDLTFKQTTLGRSRVVGDLWGIVTTENQPEYYLLSSVVRRMGFEETRIAIEQLSTGATLSEHVQSAMAFGYDCAQLWAKATTCLVEAKANGPAVADSLAKRVRSIVLTEPQGDKVERFSAIVGLYRTRRVWHPAVVTDGLAEREDNLVHFPRGRADDECDTTSQFLIWAESRRSRLAEAVKRMRENP